MDYLNTTFKFGVTRIGTKKLPFPLMGFEKRVSRDSQMEIHIGLNPI
jgi:hypothetical protein